ncbi:MAG: AfsR/SARP family transcriptional regulator [Acidimicrobiia bacterium]
MEYRVLGRLEVLRDGEVIELGAHRQRTLLAVLLTSANSVVAMDEILEALWGEDGASAKQNALWVYISGLRKALEPDREKRTDGTVLLTRSPGYVLAASEDAIDAVQFEKLVAEGRALGETDPAAASLVLGEALALWRGKPYEEFTYDSFFQGEIARLNELRLEAVEVRGSRPSYHRSSWRRPTDSGGVGLWCYAGDRPSYRPRPITAISGCEVVRDRFRAELRRRNRRRCSNPSGRSRESVQGPQILRRGRRSRLLRS